MYYIPRYLQQLRYPVQRKPEHLRASKQPFNSDKMVNNLFLTLDNTLVHLGPSNNGILPAHLELLNANRILTFPDVKIEWFEDGFPKVISPKQDYLTSSVIDVIPVDYFANVSGTFTISDIGQDSYWMRDNQVIEGELRGYSKAGELIGTAMYLEKHYNKYFENTMIVSKGIWKLVNDFGLVSERLEADKSINLVTGITEDEARLLSKSIGFTDGITGRIEGIRALSSSLSNELTNHLPTNINISKQLKLNTTIRYYSQKKVQRIGLYQFYRSFEIIPSQRAYDSLKNKFGYSDVYEHIKFRFNNPVSLYPTNHYQSVYVLEP